LQGETKSHRIGQAIEDSYDNLVQPFFLLLAQRDQVPSWETLQLQKVLFLELKYLRVQLAKLINVTVCMQICNN